MDRMRPFLEVQLSNSLTEKHIIINVGRQFGSGGKDVAEALGRKLGIPVYDEELLAKAAEASGISEAMFRDRDEKKNFFNLGLSRNDDTIFKIQSDTIRSIAEQGSAIFIGRASDYVLRDMKCLDVFICSPLDFRIKRVSDHLGISVDEAEKLIIKTDRSRESYYNFFTFSNWGVASNYDLCLDASLLGIENTADFIIEFGRSVGIL